MIKLMVRNVLLHFLQMNKPLRYTLARHMQMIIACTNQGQCSKPLLVLHNLAWIINIMPFSFLMKCRCMYVAKYVHL